MYEIWIARGKAVHSNYPSNALILTQVHHKSSGDAGTLWMMTLPSLVDA
jgi:hypothetical protein